MRPMKTDYPATEAGEKRWVAALVKYADLQDKVVDDQLRSLEKLMENSAKARELVEEMESMVKTKRKVEVEILGLLEVKRIEAIALKRLEL